MHRIFWAIGPSPSSLIARGVAATTPIQPAAPHQNSHFANSGKSEVALQRLAAHLFCEGIIELLFDCRHRPIDLG